MEEIRFPADFDLVRPVAMRQQWKRGARFVMDHPRPTHAQLLFVRGEGACSREGESVRFGEGDLVLIPAGARYVWHFAEELPETVTLLFEFLLRTPKGEAPPPADTVALLASDARERFEPLFLRLIRAGSIPLPRPALVKSVAYALLDEAAQCLRRAQNRVSEGEWEVIAPGVFYLENDISQEKSIREVAELCHVSCAYFERLFRRYAGMSPERFRLERKLDRAELLLSANGSTLESVAEELGFCDSAHLAHLFRRLRGHTPRGK